MIELDPQLIHSNGTTKVKIVARDGDKIIDAELLTIESSQSRKRFAKRLAEKSGEKADTLERQMLSLLDTQGVSATAKPAAEMLLAETSEHVRQDAADLLRRPQLVEEIKRDIGRAGVAGNGDFAFGVYVIGTSRLQARPLAGIGRGASSSGKSYEIRVAASMFPPETKIEAHHLSAKALYYLPDDALIHSFVVAGERSRRQDDETADATKALREMLSDGVLRAAVTENINGELRTIQFEKKGPIAFVESTSAATIFAEDQNRCLVFPVDESPEQTKAIIRAAANAASECEPDLSASVIETHWAMQRMLRPVRVVIPYAKMLSEGFPAVKVEARRVWPHLLNTINAVAILHQFQKQAQAGVILADARDYEIGMQIIAPTMRRLSGSIDEQAKRVWKAISDKAGADEEFTRNSVACWAGISESDAGGRLRFLVELGYLIETEEHRGNKPAKFKVSISAPTDEPESGIDLPSVADVQASCGGHFRK